MRSIVLLCVLLTLCLIPARLRAEDPPVRQKPIIAGGLAINPHDILAVYRPVDNGALAIYLGRPGHGIQAIIIKDNKEATAVFTDIWDNQDVTKDPGEDDTRPLTRMRPKDAERKYTPLIANVSRLLAIVWDTDRRNIRVYLDKFLGNEALADPNGGDAMDALEIQNLHADAEMVMAAYKSSVTRK